MDNCRVINTRMAINKYCSIRGGRSYGGQTGPRLEYQG
jgi:hypothetical protein